MDDAVYEEGPHSRYSRVNSLRGGHSDHPGRYHLAQRGIAIDIPQPDAVKEGTPYPLACGLTEIAIVAQLTLTPGYDYDYPLVVTITTPPSYTSGLRGPILTLGVGAVIFGLGVALIWLPVYQCWQGPNPGECFAPGNAFMLLGWIGLTGIALFFWIVNVVWLLVENFVNVRSHR